MRILVIGGAGMLGHQILLQLANLFGRDSLACTLRKPRSHYARFGIFESGEVFDCVDVIDWSKVEKVLGDYRPDWIINCVGLTLRKKDLADLEKAIHINSWLPHLLAKWGGKHRARMVHFSTDCIFSGRDGGYREDDIPDAKDFYGKSKFLGEVHYDNALTMRLSIVGRELEGKTELIEWFLSQRGQAIKGYSRAMYSGLTTNEAAKEVGRIIRNFPNLAGVYHLASHPIAKSELLRIVNDVYGCQTAIEDDPRYPADKTLNCDRYSSLTGFVKPRWREMILEMKKEEVLNYES